MDHPLVANPEQVPGVGTPRAVSRNQQDFLRRAYRLYLSFLRTDYHIQGWDVTRQAIEGIVIKPDCCRSIILTFPSEGIPTDVVKNYLDSLILCAIADQQRPTIGELFEHGGAGVLSSQRPYLLDLDGSSGPSFQVFLNTAELKLHRIRSSSLASFSTRVARARGPRAFGLGSVLENSLKLHPNGLGSYPPKGDSSLLVYAFSFPFVEGLSRKVLLRDKEK
jgi:hypothetical protein